MSQTDRHKIEKEKYLHCFLNGTTANNGKTYGEGNHGQGAEDFFCNTDIKSLIDVGAGQGKFVNNLAARATNLEKIYALDIASVTAGVNIEHEKITWFESYTHNIPLSDNEVEWVTSFDCLEHILPEDITATCNEFFRVCSVGAMVKIAYRGCIERTLIFDNLPEDQRQLHLSVFSKEVWIQHFKNAGFKKVQEYKKNNFLDKDNYLIFYKD